MNLLKQRGIIAGLSTIGIVLVFHLFPALAELLYGQLVYPLYQFIRSVFSVVSPFALFYIVICGFMFVLTTKVIQMIKQKLSVNRWLVVLGNSLGWLICLFYLQWGFNYTRPGIEKKLNLTIEQPDRAYIFNEYERIVNELNATRRQLPEQDTIARYGKNRNKVKQDANEQVKAFVKQSNYPVWFPVFLRQLVPRGILMKISTSGVFFPFSGEANIDAGLPDSSIPSVMAHEFSHAYGVSNEGECNFIAYQACRRSGDPFVRYSGSLSYYSYAARNAQQADSVCYNQLSGELDSLVIRDMESRRRAHRRFKDVFPGAINIMYDQYLKAQGLEKGIDDYDKVYLLQYAYQKKNKDE